MIAARLLLCAAALALLATTPAWSEEILVLNRTFIEKFKNRLTIEAKYIVDAAHKKPNPADKDGDMHVAGRSPDIGLAVVAEIQNAKDAPEAVKIVRDVEGSNKQINVEGVWRIWPEHGGDKTHDQITGAGPKFTGIGPTNPPHVFEIHPVLKVENEDVRSTLKPIEGFEPKNARDAFTRYEHGFFEISATPKAKRVTMRMRMVGFNYVEFVMRVNKRFKRESDGEFLSASVLTLDDELLVHDRRIGFVAGTAPDEKQKALKEGECIRILGIPRVDLALVSWRINNASKKPDVLKWGMPYEIIAVGVFDDQPRECGDE
jgi:hypothetical protein